MFSKKLFSVLAVLMGMVISFGAYAQKITVRGTVSDASGPVIGAAVISGSTGTVTDVDGSFAISVNPDAVLEVTCLGYQPQQIPVQGRQQILVVLEEDNNMLEDAVVVGYGTTKKANLTGAVSVVKADDLKDRSALDVGHMLQGTVPGLNITSASGRPGQAASINIRGRNSINGGNPLVLVDGVEGDLQYLNPADVESEQFAVTVRQAEHAYVVADVDSAAEGQTVKLTVTLDEGYALQGWNVLHGDVIINEDGTFLMPDDNVTIQPVIVDKSAVYALDFTNVLAGTIPEGWRVVQEDNAVHEYPNNYSSGARTFSGFTGYQGKALYWRVNNCEYGRQNAFPLLLEEGEYKLTFAMAAWKEKPTYKVRILNSSNAVVATTEVLTATPNANGNTAANLASATLYELPFEVTQKGNHVISFLNNGTGFDEFLLLECRVNMTGATGIHEQEFTSTLPAGIYSMQGVRRETLQRGINIVVTPDGKTRKVLY